MAKKKKKEQTQKTKAVSKQINCTCGFEWDIEVVEADETIHTTNDFRYRFLRRFETNKNGFYTLIAVTGCPNCRDKK